MDQSAAIVMGSIWQNFCALGLRGRFAGPLSVSLILAASASTLGQSDSTLTSHDAAGVRKSANENENENENDNTEWRERLVRLSEAYRGANRNEMARQVAAWSVLPAADRQLLFLPTDDLVSEPLDDQDPLDQVFLSLRKKRAAALWTQVLAQAESGEIAAAYRLVYQVLREDPHHELASRVLSLLEPHAPIRVVKGTGREKRLGWPAGRYWRVSSAHFSIITDASRDDAAAIAELFESYHCAWRQLFVTQWTSARAVKESLQGRPLRWQGRRRHQVVLFANREEFVRKLRQLEPRIEIATGVYRDKDQTTYLYTGDASLRSTWIHELTHQLFQESNATKLDVAAASNFWMVEAIAMYCESMKLHDGFCVFGGWESPRLQTARFRRRNEQFYLPLEQLAALSKQQLQHHPEIRRLYTQSAGLAHFFMDGRKGEYQERFVEMVSQLYRRPGEAFRIGEVLGMPTHRLDDQYLDFLDVQDSDLATMPDVNSLEQLSLGFTQVTDAGLQYLRGATRLQWLDLSGLPITATGLAPLRECTALKRLTLAGTSVTDQAIENLSACRELEQLDLSATRITDGSLVELAKHHPRLQSLWLSDTQVTARGLKALAKLEQLTELDIAGTRVSPSEWGELQRDLFPGLGDVVHDLGVGRKE